MSARGRSRSGSKNVNFPTREPKNISSKKNCSGTPSVEHTLQHSEGFNLFCEGQAEKYCVDWNIMVFIDRDSALMRKTQAAVILDTPRSKVVQLYCTCKSQPLDNIANTLFTNYKYYKENIYYLLNEILIEVRII